MDLTLRFRAYLPGLVASEAWRHIDILRQIRNHAVRDYYTADYTDKPSEYDQHKKFTDWKQQWPAFSNPSAHAAQQAISQIRDDLDGLEEKRENGYDVDRLRWQGNGEFRSISYNQSSRFNVDHNTATTDSYDFASKNSGGSKSEQTVAFRLQKTSTKSS